MLCATAAVAAMIVGAASPAAALVINATFDSSITSLANAAAIEQAFNTVAQRFQTSLTSPVTVNIQVSWGSVAGQAIRSGFVSSSAVPLYGTVSYNNLNGYLDASARLNPQDLAFTGADANLPAAAPPGLNAYVIPYAEAKALGLAPGDQTAKDGYIGFSSLYAYDFNPTGGVNAGSFDFQGLAFHEIEEVLGRVSGLTSSFPTYRSVFDLFRYGAPGVLSFSYGATAYFSTDGGVTNLGNFNFSGGGDRSDWAALIGSTDAQLAYLPSGKVLTFGSADWSGLDALGWNQTYTPWFLHGGGGFSPMPTLQDGFAAVPEPATWGFLLAGFAMAGCGLRRRRLAVSRR